MRILILSAAIAMPLLAACSTTGGISQYQKDMSALEKTCTERQGILTPTGLQTGRPETEYACTITGALLASHSRADAGAGPLRQFRIVTNDMTRRAFPRGGFFASGNHPAPWCRITRLIT